MGNFMHQRRWLTKPSWLDFACIAIGWGALLGYFAFTVEKWWWIIVIAILYVVIVYSAYKHVKAYQDSKKNDQ